MTKRDVLYGVGGYDAGHASSNELDVFIHDTDVTVKHFDADGSEVVSRDLFSEEEDFFFTTPQDWADIRAVQVRANDFLSLRSQSLIRPTITATVLEDRGNYVIDGGVNERIFGHKSTGTPQVIYTDDGWATQAVFRDMTTAGTIVWAWPVDESTVLVEFTGTDPGDTGLYRVTATTEVKVITWTVDPAQIGFSLDRWPFHGDNPGQIILVGEYGAQVATDYARHLRLSEDGGQTFRVIFELPEEDPGSTHLHGAHYDPWADRMWAVSGDRTAAQNAWYSDDWQEVTPTWTRVWPAGTAPMQFTSLYAFQDLVVFNTDAAGEQGLWAWRRNPDSPAGVPEVKPWRILVDDTVIHWVGRSFVPTADSTGVYCWMTKAHADYSSVLIGTTDGGWSWRVLHETALNVSVIPSGVYQDQIVWRDGGNKVRATVDWD